MVSLHVGGLTTPLSSFQSAQERMECIPLASSSKENFPHLLKRKGYRALQKLVQSGVQPSDLLPYCPYKEGVVLAQW